MKANRRPENMLHSVTSQAAFRCKLFLDYLVICDLPVNSQLSVNKTSFDDYTLRESASEERFGKVTITTHMPVT